MKKEFLGFNSVIITIGHFLGSASEENRLHRPSNKGSGKIFRLAQFNIRQTFLDVIKAILVKHNALLCAKGI